MIFSIIAVWLSCGLAATFVMSRVLSHARAMVRAQREMKRT